MEYGIFKTAIDSGLSMGIFGLCVWLVITIVNKLCGTMDKLSTKMEIFMNKVKSEHEASIENQKSIMQQHAGIIDTLGRINGYKDEKGV